MSQESLARNTAYITIASVLQKVISFVYFTIVARNMGAEGTGKYFFALSFTTIFVVFVDLGLTNVLVREGAKSREKLQQYFSTVLSAKIFFGILSYTAIFVVINALGYPLETKYLVYVSGITMLFDSLHLTLYGILRSVGNLKYEALAIVGSQFFTLVLGSIFLFLKLPLIYLMIAFLIPSFLNVFYVGVVVTKKYGFKFIPKYDPQIFKFIFKIAIPFALAAIFSRVYGYIDSILLSKLAGDEVVGWYSIPYKVAYAFQFIPLALVAALYPRFSEYFVHNKEKLHYTFHQGVKYLLLISLPIVVGIGLLAEDIVVSVFTAEYLNSILPLQILMVGVVFGFINMHFGALLNACNRQVTQTMFVGIVMVVNIILNIILIPEFGAVGAAIAAVSGNMVLSVLNIFIIPKITAVNLTFLVKASAQISVAVGVMGAAVWYTDIYTNFVIAIIVGAVVYPTALFITRAITKEQLREAIFLVKR